MQPKDVKVTIRGKGELLLRSENLLVNRVKVPVGLLSKRAGVFLLFNTLYGFVFSAHFAQFFRFSLEQAYSPHFSLILLVSLYLMYARRQQLFACAESCIR